MNAVTHHFRLILDRWPDDSEWDDLADTCHDAEFGRPSGTPHAEFSRTASGLVEAIASAIHELQTHHELQTVGVESVDLLWWVDIADRIGMHPDELEAKLAASPVVHSKPMRASTSTGCDYHWPDIVAWLAAHGIPASAYDKTIQATNLMLPTLPVGVRTPNRMIHAIAYQIKRIDMWRMPGWMEPWDPFIAETGGNEIEELIFSFDTEDRLIQTNLPRFVLACMVRAQVGLLQRLHQDGSLPPAPNAPGGPQ